MSNSRFKEQAWPYFVGLLAAVAAGFLLERLVIATSEAKDVFAQVLTFFAIATGFLGTTLTVLVAITDRPIIRDLKRTRTFSLVLRYLIAALRHSFSVVVITVPFFVAQPRLDKVHPRTILLLDCLWSGYVVLALCTVIRVFSLFAQVVVDQVEEEERQEHESMASGAAYRLRTKSR